MCVCVCNAVQWCVFLASGPVFGTSAVRPNGEFTCMLKCVHVGYAIHTISMAYGSGVCVCVVTLCAMHKVRLCVNQCANPCGPSSIPAAVEACPAGSRTVTKIQSRQTASFYFMWPLKLSGLCASGFRAKICSLTNPEIERERVRVSENGTIYNVHIFV